MSKPARRSTPAVAWDKLAPLVDWVERGKAPESIVVTQDKK